MKEFILFNHETKEFYYRTIDEMNDDEIETMAYRASEHLAWELFMFVRDMDEAFEEEE